MLRGGSVLGASPWMFGICAYSIRDEAYIHRCHWVGAHVLNLFQADRHAGTCVSKVCSDNPTVKSFRVVVMILMSESET